MSSEIRNLIVDHEPDRRRSFRFTETLDNSTAGPGAIG